MKIDFFVCTSDLANVSRGTLVAVLRGVRPTVSGPRVVCFVAEPTGPGGDLEFGIEQMAESALSNWCQSVEAAAVDGILDGAGTFSQKAMNAQEKMIANQDAQDARNDRLASMVLARASRED